MVLAVSLACVVVQTSLWCWTYIRQVGILPIPIWDWSVLRPFLALVLIGYLSNLINLVNYRFDVWVVGNYAGTAQLGLYAVAVGMGQLLFYIPEPFARVVQPFLYGQVENEMLARFKFISRLNFTTVLVLALLIGLSAPWIVPLFYGPTFNGSVIALQCLLPGIVAMSFYKLTAPLVVQGGMIRFNLYAISVAAVITIALDFLLIPAWGIVGASVASSISYFSLMVSLLGDPEADEDFCWGYVPAATIGCRQLPEPDWRSPLHPPIQMTGPHDNLPVPLSIGRPLVSAILPCLNAAPYLAECIRSVIDRSWGHWELLFVDNGSTDGSMAVARSFADPPIQVFEETRKGVSYARNLALDRMRGKLFCFLDADDQLPVDSIRLRLDLLRRFPEAQFADGAMVAHDAATRAPIWKRSPWFQGEPFDALMRLDGSCFIGNTWLIKRASGAAYRFPEHMTHSEDLAFFLGISRQGKYVSTPRTVLHYRTGHASATLDSLSGHSGYTDLFQCMRQLNPAPSGKQLDHAWTVLRRIMFRDLVKRGHFLKAAFAWRMPTPGTDDPAPGR
ncbi:MAG: glycosyltransferase [Flavobacteriales bacterium]|nr:glycosyltransferase [Flavobacteriales bacterium]